MTLSDRADAAWERDRPPGFDRQSAAVAEAILAAYRLGLARGLALGRDALEEPAADAAEGSGGAGAAA